MYQFLKHLILSLAWKFITIDIGRDLVIYMIALGLTEESVRDWDHLKELLSICEGEHISMKKMHLIDSITKPSSLSMLLHHFSPKADRGNLFE